MQITRLETIPALLPFARPIDTAIHHMDSAGCLLVRLHCDQGLVGEGYVFTLNGTGLHAYQVMVQELGYHYVGRDPRYVEAIWQNVWHALNPGGQSGVGLAALSALDVACWDLSAKLAELPLHHMLGACRDTVPAYASSGLWLSRSIDELVQEAYNYVEDGFAAMKIRLGSGDHTNDVARVAAVRAAVGSDVRLLVDMNQGLSARQATALGRLLEPFAIEWIEEPTPVYDLTGHARVRNALPTMAIASGETVYSRYGVKTLIDADACDILMPDLQRMGGYSEFMKAAHLAAAHNIPVSSHFFTEHSLALAGSISNCISVEHIDWFAPLFVETMEIVQGDIVIPDRYGSGFTFDADAIRNFRIDN